jgi:hypothetical protein
MQAHNKGKYCHKSQTLIKLGKCMLIGVERFRQRNVEIEKEKFDLQQQEDVCHVVAQPTAMCQK